MDRSNYFVTLATSLNLNIDTFNADLAGDNVNKKITFDQALAKRVKVTGTPTVYMNGTVVPLDILTDATKLDAAVVAELEKNGIKVPKN